MTTTCVTAPAAEVLLDQCAELELDVTVLDASDSEIVLRGPRREKITVDLTPGAWSMIEQVLRAVSFRFEDLPLLTVGESKEIRLLTAKVSVARLLPTVYSFTSNRYGLAPGTELVRARFSAEVFRVLAREPGSRHIATAFLGLIESSDGPFLAEQVVDPGNIEVRVKRYHIGTPIHRYRYTERHGTARSGPPLTRWSRFDSPVVCFDWRNPLHDEEGRRLADEPLSDDYAAVWLDNPCRAKQLAKDAFESLELLFARGQLRLIDICFFIDQSGTVIFGEISPDCMRIRSRAADDSDALDKDEWRSGGEADAVLDRYQRLYNAIFGLRPDVNSL